MYIPNIYSLSTEKIKWLSGGGYYEEIIDRLLPFERVLLLASRDHELVSTVPNRIVEITPDGVVDRVMGFEEYLEAG